MIRFADLPERITVLFAAADPIETGRLRLDAEVQGIGERIRMSEHREAIALESRWALRPPDLLQALSELRPYVVHFSGHGDHHAIVFEGPTGEAMAATRDVKARPSPCCVCGAGASRLSAPFVAVLPRTTARPDLTALQEAKHRALREGAAAPASSSAVGPARRGKPSRHELNEKGDVTWRPPVVGLGAKGFAGLCCRPSGRTL